MKNVRYIIAYILLTNSIFTSVTYADVGPTQTSAPTIEVSQDKQPQPQSGKVLSTPPAPTSSSPAPQTQHVGPRAQHAEPHAQDGQEKHNQRGRKMFGRTRQPREQGPLTPVQRLGGIIFTLSRVKKELKREETPKRPHMKNIKKQKPKGDHAKKGNKRIGKALKPVKPLPPLPPLPQCIDNAIKNLTELKEILIQQKSSTTTVTPQPAVAKVEPAVSQQ